MPAYYNQYAGQNYYGNYPYNTYANTAWGNSGAQIPQGPQYMINVDGEVGARAWQMPNNLPPNTVIPLFDLDGQHIYFRSVDQYGRMNPLRKAHVVFEEETVNLPQGNSGASAPQAAPASEEFVTKEDLKSLKDEIRQMFSENQNGRNSVNASLDNNRQNRGGHA